MRIFKHMGRGDGLSRNRSGDEMKYTHKLFGGTYVAIKNVDSGVEFKVLETGEMRVLSNNQIAKLLVSV